MVLPSSAPDDEPRPREADWVEQIRLGLRLSRAGILIHVDHARLERLGRLVQGLVTDHPDLEVHTDVRAAEAAPEGSVLVLIPRAEDAGWLNIRRPIFARRGLKVILFCDHETTVDLAQRAVDFFDWISQHHNCPPGPVLHAVHGLRCAAQAEAPGILWTSASDDPQRLLSAFSAALPGEDLRWVAPERDYEALLHDVRSAGEAWVACRVQGESHLRRFRWALAEAHRRTRAIAVSSSVSSPGWWSVHDRMMPLEQARRALEEAGAARPGCLAALVGLEPEAVELARALLARGVRHEEMTALLGKAVDPGAALAIKAKELGLVDLAAVARRQALPPPLRAFGGTPEVEHLRGEWRKEIRTSLDEKKPVSIEALGSWAAESDAYPSLTGDWPASAELTFVTEANLRHDLTPDAWAKLSEIAASLGEPGAARVWALRSVEQTGQMMPGASKTFEKLVPPGERPRAMIARWQRMARLHKQLARGLILGVVLLVVQIIISAAVVSSGVQFSWRLFPGLTVAVFLPVTVWLVREWFAMGSQQPKIIKDSAAAHRSLVNTLLESLQRLHHSYEEGAYAGVARGLEGMREDITVVFGAEHPVHRDALKRLAAALAAQGEDQEALAVLREAIAIEGRVDGVDRAPFAVLVVALAGVLNRVGSSREAELLLRKALAPELSAVPLAEMEPALQRPDIAQDAQDETGELLRRFLTRKGEATPLPPEAQVQALRHLAEALIAQGRYTEAEIIARRAHERTGAALPSKHPEQWRARSTLAQALALEGRNEEAEQALRAGLQIVQRTFGQHHLEAARVLRELARIEARMTDPKAASTAQQALAIYGQAEVSAAEREAAQRELTRIAEPARGAGSPVVAGS